MPCFNIFSAMKEERLFNTLIKFFSVLILLWAITMIFNFIFALALATQSDISQLLPHILLVSVPVIFSVVTAYLVLKGSPYARKFSLYLAISYLLFAGASIVSKSDIKFQERYETITVARYKNLPETQAAGKSNPEKLIKDRINIFKKRRIQGFVFMILFFSFFAMTLNKRIFRTGSTLPKVEQKGKSGSNNSSVKEVQ